MEKNTMKGCAWNFLPCALCGKVGTAYLDQGSVDASIGSPWSVVCDVNKGGCGTRTGYRENAARAVYLWNTREGAPVPCVVTPVEPPMEPRDVKFFSALEAMGKGWKTQSEAIHKLMLETAKAVDARLCALEGVVVAGSKDKQARPYDGGKAEMHGFRRAGFMFAVTHDPMTRVTAGDITRTPLEFQWILEMGGAHASTRWSSPDVYSAKRGVRIVLAKLIAHIKSAIVGKATHQLKRVRNMMKDIKVNLSGAKIVGPKPEDGIVVGIALADIKKGDPVCMAHPGKVRRPDENSHQYAPSSYRGGQPK